MDLQEQINAYIDSQSGPGRSDLQILHELLLQWLPGQKLWFLDGRNSAGKVVSNPNIGYGTQTMQYADGSGREFYRVGLSANTAGISVYIIGIADKTYLAQSYGSKIGKATVTGYCIKFRKLKDINMEVLKAAIQEAQEMP